METTGYHVQSLFFTRLVSELNWSAVRRWVESVNLAPGLQQDSFLYLWGKTAAFFAHQNSYHHGRNYSSKEASVLTGITQSRYRLYNIRGKKVILVSLLFNCKQSLLCLILLIPPQRKRKTHLLETSSSSWTSCLEQESGPSHFSWLNACARVWVGMNF